MSWGLTGTARVSQCGDMRFSFFLGMGKQSFTATQSEARQAAWRARSRATTGSHSVPKPTSQDQSRGDPALQALRAQGAVLSGDAGPGAPHSPSAPQPRGRAPASASGQGSNPIVLASARAPASAGTGRQRQVCLGAGGVPRAHSGRPAKPWGLVGWG